MKKNIYYNNNKIIKSIIKKYIYTYKKYICEKYKKSRKKNEI